MSVGLMVGYNWWTIGEGSLFNSIIFIGAMFP